MRESQTTWTVPMLAENDRIHDLRERELREPPLLPLLDLVALATVADVAPLIGANRAFVRQGLSIMARRASSKRKTRRRAHETRCMRNVCS